MKDMSLGFVGLPFDYNIYAELGDCPNIETLVSKTDIMWKTIKQKKGWKIQYNKVTKHSRIVDPNNIRKAWGTTEIMEEKFKRLTRDYFLEAGDVIGVARKKALKIYEHYAIYIGGGRVVHYSGGNDDFKGGIYVRTDTLERFLGDDEDYFVLFFDKPYVAPRKIQRRTSFNFDDMSYDNYLCFQRDKNFKIYSPKETVARALSKVGEDKYNLVINNCEHFAVWCKTGVSKSYQVQRAIRTVIRAPYLIYR